MSMRCRQAREIIARHYLKQPVDADELQQAKLHASRCLRCAAKSLEMVRAIAFGQEKEASCEEYRQLLFDHVAGETKRKGALERFSRMQNHLSYCPSCHREYLVLQELEKAMKKKGKAVQYPEFDLSFLHSEATEEPKKERAFGHWPWNVQLRGRKLATVALASAVFAVIIIACFVPIKLVTYTEIVAREVTEIYYEQEPYTEQEQYTVTEPKQLSTSLTYIIPPNQELLAPLLSVDLSGKQENRITVAARTNPLIIELPPSNSQSTHEQFPPKVSYSIERADEKDQPQSHTSEGQVGEEDYRYSYVPDGQVEFSFVPTASGTYHLRYLNENSYPLAMFVSATWNYEKTTTKYRDITSTRAVKKERVVTQICPETHQERVSIFNYLFNRQ